MYTRQCSARRPAEACRAHRATRAVSFARGPAQVPAWMSFHALSVQWLLRFPKKRHAQPTVIPRIMSIVPQPTVIPNSISINSQPIGSQSTISNEPIAPVTAQVTPTNDLDHPTVLDASSDGRVTSDKYNI